MVTNRCGIMNPENGTQCKNEAMALCYFGERAVPMCRLHLHSIVSISDQPIGDIWPYSVADQKELESMSALGWIKGTLKQYDGEKLNPPAFNRSDLIAPPAQTKV